MSKKIKLAIAVVAVFVITISATMYVVSQKIKPDDIRKITIKSLESALPGSKVSLGKVDYSLGTSVRVYLNEFAISNKKDKSRLAHVKKIMVKVPVLSILTGGGSIEVNVDAPSATLEMYKASNNWAKILPKPSKVKKDAPREESPQTTVEIPSFVKGSKINIKVSDLDINFKAYKSKKSNIKLKKILLKNINLKTSTAYEVISDINFYLDAKTLLKSKVQVVGEVKLADIIEKGVFDSKVVIDLQETSLSGLDFKIPNVKSKIEVKMSKEGVIDASVDTRLDSLVALNLKANVNKSKVNISKIFVSIKNKEALNYLPESLKSSLKGVELGESEIQVNGNVDLDIATKKISPNVSITMKKPITISMEGMPKATTTFESSYKGEDFKLNSKANLFGGVVTTMIDTSFNPLKLPKSIASYKPINIKLLATNFSVSRKFLQSFLYKNKDASEKAAVTPKKKYVPGSAVILPKTNISIDAKHIFIGKNQLTINGAINAHRNTVRSKGIMVKFGTGTTNVGFNTVLKTSNNISNDFSVKLRKMNMAALNAFLPPFLSEIDGTYAGDVKGSLSMAKVLNYNISAKVSATNGELKNLNVKDIVGSFFESIKDKFPKKYENYSDKFKRLSVNVRANTKKVDVKNFEMIGNQDSLALKLAGQVSMGNSNSKLKGTIKTSSISEQVKKHTGAEDLPIVLKGKGFVLMPDIGYTTGEIAKRAAGNIVNKEKKKVQAKVNKEVSKQKKKLEDEIKKKAKNLFKGIKF